MCSGVSRGSNRRAEQAANPPPNTDVETCAIFVMGVARKVNDPALTARFASLPKAEFDMVHVRDLGALALGTWYATTELASASATSTEAKLPAALVKRATERKMRMLKVVVYHFEDHPTLGPEVADIILGTGYRDMASDLTRLAKVYTNERATVEKDPKHYRADDEAEALKDAREILDHLSAARSSEARMWADVVARSWTLMSQSYNEVSGAGNWLLRNEGGAEIFLPLVAAGRLGRAKPRKQGTPDDGTDGEDEEPEHLSALRRSPSDRPRALECSRRSPSDRPRALECSPAVPSRPT